MGPRTVRPSTVRRPPHRTTWPPHRTGASPPHRTTWPPHGVRWYTARSPPTAPHGRTAPHQPAGSETTAPAAAHPQASPAPHAAHRAVTTAPHRHRTAWATAWLRDRTARRGTTARRRSAAARTAPPHRAVRMSHRTRPAPHGQIAAPQPQPPHGLVRDAAPHGDTAPHAVRTARPPHTASSAPRHAGRPVCGVRPATLRAAAKITVWLRVAVTARLRRAFAVGRIAVTARTPGAATATLRRSATASRPPQRSPQTPQPRTPTRRSDPAPVAVRRAAEQVCGAAVAAGKLRRRSRRSACVHRRSPEFPRGWRRWPGTRGPSSWWARSAG